MTRHDAGVLATTQKRSVGWFERGNRDGLAVLWFHGQPGSCLEQKVLTDESLERHGLRIVSIDRAGYGDTDPVGIERRPVIDDALAVLDHLAIERVVTIGVSMGGTFAMAAAAFAPGRVSRAVLVSANAMPYDDERVVADLRSGEQEDVALLRSGDRATLDATYAEYRDALATDPMPAFDALTFAEFSAREQRLWREDWVREVFRSEVVHGLAPGHAGYLDDGLRTIAPLDFDLAAVRCPVRAIHGSQDSLEPLSNVRRLVNRLPDAQLFVIEGVNHFGPWLWPDLVAGLVIGDR